MKRSSEWLGKTWGLLMTPKRPWNPQGTTLLKDRRKYTCPTQVQTFYLLNFLFYTNKQWTQTSSNAQLIKLIGLIMYQRTPSRNNLRPFHRTLHPYMKYLWWNPRSIDTNHSLWAPQVKHSFMFWLFFYPEIICSQALCYLTKGWVVHTSEFHHQ